MAHKRQRGESWEYVVKRAGLLEKPLTLTFKSEAEGDEYCRKLEALLDRGIVPTEYKPATRITSLSQLIERYMDEVAVPGKDEGQLKTLVKQVGGVSVLGLDADWVDGWIERMKREDNYAPSTIQAKVGALARCCDWGMRKKLIVLPDHPLRTLRDGYATYTRADAAFVEPREDVERDRRLEGDEEARIRAVIAKGVLPRRQRTYTIEHPTKVLAIFELALETAMRLREMATLTPDQVNLKLRTIYLDKTKNGDKRIVSLTTVAVKVLEELLASCGDYVFPWLERNKMHQKYTSNFISKLFAGIFAEAGCPDLTFHDLRHEATSRLFERTTLATEEIMKQTGHKTHRMMMRYLKLRSTTVVSKLW